MNLAFWLNEATTRASVNLLHHASHRSNYLAIGLSMLLMLMISISQASQDVSTDSPWRQWLTEDLNAAQTLIADHYIYSYTRAGDESWAALVETAFDLAHEQSASVNDFAGYQAVIQRLLSQFEDTHLRALFSLNQQRVQWPGFVVHASGNTYRVSHSIHGHIPVGAQITECDGQSLDQWIEALAPWENHIPTVAATREWLAPELFVKKSHGFVATPSACVINGQRVNLEWTSITHDRLSSLQTPDDPTRPPLGLTRIHEDLAWIRLPSMAPRNERDAQSFHTLIEQAPTLRSTPQVVIDVRGNGGGPYQWFMALLRGLYGEHYVDYHATARLEITPWFVDGSYRAAPPPSADEPATPDPLNTPKDPPLDRTIASVNPITLDNGETVTALEPTGDRYARPDTPGPSLFEGTIYVLTDGRCASACLSLIDELKRLGQVVHIGTPTWVDRRSGSPRPYPLPSGLSTLIIPSMVRVDRARDDNEAWYPDLALPIDTHHTPAVIAWLDQRRKANLPDHQTVDIREPIRRSHEGQFNGQALGFESVYEEFVVSDAQLTPSAILSSISYIADPVHQSTDRPVIFVFQGGPGSSAIWSHLGLLGPKRIRFDDPSRPQTVPPFAFEDNPYALLDVADVVFIDPVHTGFSRPLPRADEQALLSTTDDAASVADLITQWLTRHQRWNRPRYVMGSSFGTTRSIEVADALMGGVFPSPAQLGATTLNGLIILGPIFSRQATFAGNHRNFQTMLPTYAAAAWYHGRLAPEWSSVDDVVEAATQLAWGAYDNALDAGYLLSAAEQKRVAQSLAELTGISPELWLAHRLRIDRDTFRGLLLKDQNQSIGRFDARFVLSDHPEDADPVADDAAMGQYTPAFISTFNDYLRTHLGIEFDQRYTTIDWGSVNFRWDYGLGPGLQRPRNDAELLAKVQRRTPMLNVFIGAGLYDLGTPFAAAEYALAHAPVDRERITFKLYPSGHSPYLGEDNIKALSQDLRRFITP